MTVLDLDAIKARHAAIQADTDKRVPATDFDDRSNVRELLEYVPALVAEVERLRAINFELDEAVTREHRAWVGAHNRGVEALERLRASSVPLGMTEQQFSASTILDATRILSGTASPATSDSSSTGSQS